MSQMLPEVLFDDFLKIDLRVGTVVSAERFLEARKPAYLLRIDFGPEIGTKKTSAQVTAIYEPDALVGRQVVGLVNVAPRQIGPVRSEFLLVGVHRSAGEVVLVGPDTPAPNGARLC